MVIGMNIGKISDSVLKRSVLKEIKTKRDEIIKGAGVGEDCALFLPNEDACTAVCTETLPYYEEDLLKFAVYQIAANMAASFAEPIGLMVNILLPEEAEEQTLKEIMRTIQAACKTLNMAIAGGHTEVTQHVGHPVITLTGLGKTQAAPSNQKEFEKIKKAHKDQTNGALLELVVTKWVGLEGSIYLAKNGKESLLTRYPEKMIDEAIGFDKYLLMLPEAAHAVMSGVCMMHDISKGGVFGALWELSQKAGAGLDIDLRKIPIKQETVEICEHFGVNPYELLSGGSLIMAVEDGSILVNQLAAIGVPAAVVGYLTNSNDKIIRNGEDVRFLDKPKADEIYRFIGGKNLWN